ncbi:uncharacterized protein EI90DRAFT_3156500 [Cantharellus anzutake]|uniref:uncharacterized protein n=1 Tax=Cantharellus anzutake TaxID=1750568 RepID=UPI0019074379|nr:uncharacterized protein EI90DRAFT_3156500 [Cantharellus anzutake]KAF8326558.1 hypothetical protein EI90DRAFT_3156500 [Cantharellus anzutake]
MAPHFDEFDALNDVFLVEGIPGYQSALPTRVKYTPRSAMLRELMAPNVIGSSTLLNPGPSPHDSHNNTALVLVIVCSILCGALLLGVVSTCYIGYRGRRARARQMRAARDRLARASFKSRGSDPPCHVSVLPDPRSEWIRLGLDSPILGSSKKGAQVVDNALNGTLPPLKIQLQQSNEDQKRILKHSFSPPVPSPLASRPVWIASDSNWGCTFGRDPINNERSEKTGHMISLLEKSPQLDGVASMGIDDSPTLDSCPSTAKLPALFPDILSNFTLGCEEKEPPLAHRDSPSLDSVTYDSGEDSTSSETGSTQLTSKSTFIRTAESTEIDALLKEVAPWDHLDSDGGVHTFGSASSTTYSLRSSASLPSVLPSSTSLATAKSRLSVPISTSSSSLNTSTSTPLGSMPSRSSMNLLQDFPLPPPTIIVTTPSMASLATKKRAAHDSGAFTDEWDGTDEEASEDEERVVSIDSKIVEATVVALKTVFGEGKPKVGGNATYVNGAKGKENKPIERSGVGGRIQTPRLKHGRSSSTPRQSERNSSSASKRSSIPLLFKPRE